MKVLYVYKEFPGLYQNYLIIFLEKLKQKCNLKVMTYSNYTFSDFNIKTYSFHDYFQRFLFKVGVSKEKSLDQKIFKEFDIIHIQHSFLYNKVLPLLNIPKQNRPKIIITLRGGDTYIKPWISSNWKNFYLNFGNQIDAFITVSHHQKEYLQKWGVHENKIHVIPISFGTFSNAKPKFPNKTKIMLVSAFRMTWEKNIEGTIQLALELIKFKVDFEWHIYGEGHDLGHLYFLVDRYSLEKNVFIKGKIENDTFKNRLPDYDFYVQLSISEALSASVLEAQSMGIPCVVSDSGGLKEAVLINETAICSQYKNIEFLATELYNLWCDKERYYRFSEKAIKFVNDNFTIENEIDKTLKLYKNL